MLAVPGDEANRLRAALQHTFDRIGHLPQIHRIFHLRTAALRFDNDGIV
jgi:hypothetical protein